jgi:hypothetical protein
MSISYPPSQQNTGGGTTSTNPYAFELLVTNNLPITVSGTTGQQLVTYFFLPPSDLYKSGQNEYYLGLVSYVEGSNTSLTASFKVQPGEPFYSTTYYNNFGYSRFADTGSNPLTVNLEQVGSSGFIIPLYVSGTSDFTASVYKVYLSPV